MFAKSLGLERQTADCSSEGQGSRVGIFNGSSVVSIKVRRRRHMLTYIPGLFGPTVVGIEKMEPDQPSPLVLFNGT